MGTRTVGWKESRGWNGKTRRGEISMGKAVKCENWICETAREKMEEGSYKRKFKLENW